MPTFAQFLPMLARALDVLDTRADDHTRPFARRTPGAMTGAPGELLIGLGAPVQPDPARAVCLNNKTAAQALGQATHPSSVSRLVSGAPAVLVTAWGQALGLGTAPEAVIGGVRLVVEDASPDSCFGFVLFLARLAGVAADELPLDWIAYIDAWEQGAGPPNPRQAYGSFHNALVHFSIQATPTTAWRAGLRLLHEALSANLSPGTIGAEAGGPWLTKARAALTYDAQAYEENLRHAERLQLSIPLAGFPDRRRLIDACLFEETMAVGALRDFARADRARSALGNGFTLLGLHRPGLVGTGNDITISVDPAAGLDLRALWDALEAEEDRRWAGARPSDTPRDVGGYAGGRRRDGTPSPNQPWYHTADFTLIGAPKEVAPGQRGSHLSWAETLRILWDLYNPLHDVRFQLGLTAARAGGMGPAQPLHACAPEPVEDPHPYSPRAPRPEPEPRLIAARWDRPDNAAPAFRVTPALVRCLAYCLARPAGTHAPIRLSDLPPGGEPETFEIPGGVAVISDHGAFLLDGGFVQKAPLDDLAAAFHQAAHALRDVRASSDRIVRLLAETHDFLRGEGTETADSLLAELAWWQVRIARAEHARQAAPLTPLQRAFRAALLTRWGIEGWTGATARYVEDIKQALANHTNQEINRRVAFLQGYGLPIAAGASLFGFVFAGLSPALDFNLTGMHWKGLALYIAAVAAGCVAMRGLSWASERRAKRQLAEAGRK